MKNIFESKEHSKELFELLEHNDMSLSEILDYYISKFPSVDPDTIQEHLMQACDVYYSGSSNVSAYNDEDNISDSDENETTSPLFIDEEEVKKLFKRYLVKYNFPEVLINCFINEVPRNSIISEYIHTNTIYDSLYNIANTDIVYSLYKHVLVYNDDSNANFVLSECLSSYYHFLCKDDILYYVCDAPQHQSEPLSVLVKTNIIKKDIYTKLIINKINNIHKLLNIIDTPSQLLKLEGITQKDAISLIDHMSEYDFDKLPLSNKGASKSVVPYNVIEPYNHKHYKHKQRLYELWFRKHAENLSARARNVQTLHLKNWNTIYNYFDKDCKFFTHLLDQSTKTKTVEEIYEFVTECKKFYETHKDLCSEQINIVYYTLRYPFLSEEETRFISQYEIIHRHSPLFFILYKYFMYSQDKGLKIVGEYYGIFGNKRYSLDEIATKFDLSRERVRQLVNNLSLVSEKIDIDTEAWEHYELSNHNIIVSDNPLLGQIIHSEKLNENNAAIIIYLCLLNKCTTFFFEDIVVGFCDKESSRIPMKTIIDRIQTISRESYERDIYIEDFLNDVPKVYHSVLTPLLYKMCESLPNISVSSSGTIQYKGYVNVSNILFRILKEVGEPKHAKEIFALFKELVPQHHFDDINSIKHIMRKDKRFKVIGKTSKFALSEWTKVYSGNIKELLIELLDNSSTPLELEKLFGSVTKVYKNTNIRSIQSTMSSDNRFIEFTNNRYGLSSKTYSPMYQINNKIKRLDFETRFKDYCNFVENFHHLPFNSSSEKESSLCRWCRNTIEGRTSASDEQKNKLIEKLDEYKAKHLPTNATELFFKNKVSDIVALIDSSNRLPNFSTERDLYTWYMKYQKKYREYNDFRSIYFEELLAYIKENPSLDEFQIHLDSYTK